MRSPINVVWSEGLLLTQQHFQQFQAYMECYADWFFTSSTAFFYGMLDFCINEEALLNGIFQLERCQGFFKTGERIYLPEMIKVPIDQEGAVFLCLTEETSIENLAGYPCESSRPRYTCYSQEVGDDYDDKRQHAILSKKENYFLTQDLSCLSKTLHIKLADVLKNTVNGFYVSEEFVPACLNVFCLPQFEAYLHQLIHYIQSVLYLFDNSYYRIDTQLPSFLKQFLAKLRCAFFHKRYHPWQFYQDFYVFMSAIAQVTPISYDHDHLSAVFQYIDKKIKTTLPGLAPKKVIAVALHSQTDALFFSHNLETVFSMNMELYLHASFSLADPRLGLFCQQVKVTAVSDIESMISAALPGVSLLPVDSLPQEFKPLGCYFRLQTGGKHWEKIRSEKQLAIFLTNDFLGVDIKLLARESS